MDNIWGEKVSMQCLIKLKSLQREYFFSINMNKVEFKREFPIQASILQIDYHMKTFYASFL